MKLLKKNIFNIDDIMKLRKENFRIQQIWNTFDLMKIHKIKDHEKGS